MELLSLLYRSIDSVPTRVKKRNVTDDIRFLSRADGHRLAYAQIPGPPSQPGVVFLSGFRSDMAGTKAQGLSDLAQAHRFGYVRFDYFGHGKSSGAFEDGTIGRWADDSLAILDQVASGPQILVGSSMGGWLALLVARLRPRRIKALVLIAPAPDFTERLMWPGLPEAARAAVLDQGRYEMPSAYDPEPTILTRTLFDDARDHMVLSRPLQLACPVHILQGMQDPDVPWQHAMTLVDTLTNPDVTLTLIKDGDHRLSRPQDMAVLARTLIPLLGTAAA